MSTRWPWWALEPSSPRGLHVPPRAIAVGIPAKIRLDAVRDDLILPGVANYIRRGHWDHADLRRLS